MLSGIFFLCIFPELTQNVVITNVWSYVVVDANSWLSICFYVIKALKIWKLCLFSFLFSQKKHAKICDHNFRVKVFKYICTYKIFVCIWHTHTHTYIYAYTYTYWCVLCAKLLQSCLTLCNPVDCSPPGSSVHRILQARILEWVLIPFSRGFSQPKDQTWISRISGKVFTI